MTMTSTDLVPDRMALIDHWLTKGPTIRLELYIDPRKGDGLIRAILRDDTPVIAEVEDANGGLTLHLVEGHAYEQAWLNAQAAIAAARYARRRP